ncbi:MAG: hypothetical protein OXC08_20835 [Thiotrichales bacterium]|nr:hypothetical protein [Thiotrichales bacterium]
MADDTDDDIFKLPEENLKASKLEHLVNRYQAVVDVDPRELFDEKGDYRSPTEWSDNFTKAVKSVRKGRHGGYDVDFHDANRAAEMLTKYQGLLEDATETQTPLDSLFARIPRHELVALKEALDHMAGVDAADAKAAADSAER